MASLRKGGKGSEDTVSEFTREKTILSGASNPGTGTAEFVPTVYLQVNWE